MAPLILGVALLLMGVMGIASGLLTVSAYRELADGHVNRTVNDEGKEADAHDWSWLAGINPEVVGWVRVEGTDIDLPVARRQGDPGWYLTHDLWGSPSIAGCPFLDDRSEPDGIHLIVYGHHLAGTDEMFSPLNEAYEQETFDGLGECVWSTPALEDARFVPVCSMSVERDYADVQRFSFLGQADLRNWLTSLCRQASARRKGWENCVSGARRAVTLVTCSSDMPGQTWRTLVVFVCVGGPEASEAILRS